MRRESGAKRGGSVLELAKFVWDLESQVARILPSFLLSLLASSYPIYSSPQVTSPGISPEYPPISLSSIWFFLRPSRVHFISHSTFSCMQISISWRAYIFVSSKSSNFIWRTRRERICFVSIFDVMTSRFNPHHPICFFLLSTSGSRNFDFPLCDSFCLAGLSCFARYFAGFLHLSPSEFLAIRFEFSLSACFPLSLVFLPAHRLEAHSWWWCGSGRILLCSALSLTIAASQRATKSDIWKNERR